MTYPERALSGPHFSENHELKNEAFLSVQKMCPSVSAALFYVYR
jgi:hypothetical protein